MRYIIKQKMSGTGSIHDLASDLEDRIISGPGKYAVVLASYYGGKGYTTHMTADAAIKKSQSLYKHGFSHAIIDENGTRYAVRRDFEEYKLEPDIY